MATLHCRFRATWLALAALAAIPGSAQQPPATRQFPAYKAPHMADGHPDLNGIWQAFVTADWDLQDHEAQPGPHPEIMGAYGAGPAGRASSRAAKFPTSPGRCRRRKRTSKNAP